MRRLVYLLAVLRVFCVTASTRAPPGCGDLLLDVLQSTRRSRKPEAAQSLSTFPERKGGKGHTLALQKHVMSSGSILPSEQFP